MFRAIGEFITFRRMLGPFILQLLFWALAVGVVVFGMHDIDPARPVLGWLLIILTVLGLRLLFEVVLLAFRMYDRLGEIKTVLQSVDENSRPLAIMVDDEPDRSSGS